MKKLIKSFESGCHYDGICERRANEWIKNNNINVIDITSSASFWNGYKCQIIYTENE